jgi:hypothetical protein
VTITLFLINNKNTKQLIIGPTYLVRLNKLANQILLKIKIKVLFIAKAN